MLISSAMVIGASTSFVSAFLASFVEAVEALTIVLAAGSIRGWRSALLGTGAALLVLVAITALGGPFLLLLPLWLIRIALGLFLLFLGFKWLKKAVLRAGGAMAQRDEAKVFSRTEERLRTPGGDVKRFDGEGFATAFNGVFVEGLEIVFIVLSLGAAGNALLFVSLGAAVACLTVILLGWALHSPLTKVPENWFKFSVGVLLTSFGLFWIGEGFGLRWPGGDAALPGLFSVILLAALFAVAVVRKFVRKV